MFLKARFLSLGKSHINLSYAEEPVHLLYLVLKGTPPVCQKAGMRELHTPLVVSELARQIVHNVHNVT